jgi:hypothetical protein
MRKKAAGIRNKKRKGRKKSTKPNLQAGFETCSIAAAPVA